MVALTAVGNAGDPPQITLDLVHVRCHQITDQRFHAVHIYKSRKLLGYCRKITKF